MTRPRIMGEIWGSVLSEPRADPPKRETPAERDKREAKEDAAFRKAQPHVTVTARDLENRWGADSTRLGDITLAAAAAQLERHGATVAAGASGTLEFRWLRQSHANAGANMRAKREQVAAIRTLDAARPTVYDCLKNGRPLPDLVPSAGGGVVE